MSNYVLGRGKLFFDKFSDNDNRTLTGERYFGNTPSFSINVESEDLDHMSSDEGVNVIDDSALLSVQQNGQIGFDDISKENLALFFLGASYIVTQTSTPVTDQDVNYGNAVQEGLYYQLGANAANPAGVRDVSSVEIKDKATGATTYVLGTDYTLDAERARIKVISGSAMDGVEVTADYTPGATSRERVISGRESVYGALRFEARNPKGQQRDFFMPYVKLSPSGEFSLKGDEWQQGGFAIKIMEPSPGQPAIYCDGLPYSPA